MATPASVIDAPGTILAADSWLSGLLDRPAYTLHGPVDRVMLADTLPAAPAFVSAKVPTHPMNDALVLQNVGFRVVDTALTFAAPVNALPSRGDPRVRFARPDDEDDVVAVAGSAFRFSRFHLDPQIPQAAADRIKAEWARNYFAGARGDGMVVAKSEDGSVVGFTQLLRAEDTSLTIDLIAVAERATRHGLARAMIGHAAQHGLDETPPAKIIVGTQAANISSCRLYEGLGFQLIKSTFVLHHHGVKATK